MKHTGDNPFFGEGKRGGRHGHGHDGHRGGRVFGHGDMRFVILSQLLEKPSYGYELIKAIEERLKGAYSPSPGLVYPTLTLLEELGYITSESVEGNKKFHSITPQGRTFLDINKLTIDKINSRITRTADLHRRSEDPRLIRAMENLKLSLGLKCSASRLTNEQIKQIAAALDEAVGKIEAC